MPRAMPRRSRTRVACSVASCGSTGSSALMSCAMHCAVQTSDRTHSISFNVEVGCFVVRFRFRRANHFLRAARAVLRRCCSAPRRLRARPCVRPPAPRAYRIARECAQLLTSTSSTLLATCLHMQCSLTTESCDRVYHGILYDNEQSTHARRVGDPAVWVSGAAAAHDAQSLPAPPLTNSSLRVWASAMQGKKCTCPLTAPLLIASSLLAHLPGPTSHLSAGVVVSLK